MAVDHVVATTDDKNRLLYLSGGETGFEVWDAIIGEKKTSFGNSDRKHREELSQSPGEEEDGADSE
jgi:hypothetical protein